MGGYKKHMALGLGTVGFMTLVPLFLVIAYSFLTSADYGGIIWQFSTDSYIKLFYDYDFDDNRVLDFTYIEVFIRSIALALYTVAGCILIGFPVAYYIAVQPAKRRTILLLLVTIPFWTNLLIRNLAWIGVLRDYGLINSFLLWLGVIESPIEILYTQSAVLIGMIYSYIALLILPLYASIERLPKGLIEASQDLYANQWHSLRYVIIPLNKQALLSGSVLVFIPGMGSYITPDVLGGSKNVMLGNLIKTQFSSGYDWSFGAVLSVVFFALIGLFLLLQALLLSNKRQRAIQEYGYHNEED